MIGEKEMLSATDGHVDRMSTLFGSLEELLRAGQINPREFLHMLESLAASRDPEGQASSKHHAYVSGVIDGFVLGVRAAREEAMSGSPN